MLFFFGFVMSLSTNSYHPEEDDCSSVVEKSPERNMDSYIAAFTSVATYLSSPENFIRTASENDGASKMHIRRTCRQGKV